MQASPLALGAPVTTIMGPGTLVKIREDNTCVVELNWKLANDAKVIVYTAQEKLNSTLTSTKNTLLITKEDGDGSNADTPPVSPFAVLWPAYLCAFVDFLGAGIAIPILPYYVLELGWDSNAVCPSCPQDPTTLNATNTFRCGQVEGCGTSIEVGLSIAFFAFGQVIGNLIMSRLSDKVGRKLIIMTSLTASALGYMWCGLAENLPSLLAARACSGIAGGTLPVVQAMVLDTVGDPRSRPKFFGLASACLGLGFMVGPALGALVNAIAGSKRAAFFSPAVVASMALTVAFFKIKETKPGGGVFGPRDPLADTIYNQGKALFKKEMQELAMLRSRSVSDESVVSEGRSKSITEPGAAEPALPTIVFACAVCAVLGAFVFTCMTSMCALVWLALFNFGPTELGIFLTCIGFVSIFMNVVGVKWMIHRVGGPVTVLIAAVLLNIGIAGFTYIDIFWLHAIFFVLTINMGWSLTLPTLLDIAGANVPPQLRGKATGIIAGSMSLGFATCPLISGALFQVDVLSIKHQYGTFSHLNFIIGGCGVGLIQMCVIFKFILHPWMQRRAALQAKEQKRDQRRQEKKKQEAKEVQALNEVA